MKTAEDIIKDKGGDIIEVEAGTVIFEAVALMVAKKVGAVVVMQSGRPAGIWTSRDLMRRMVQKDFDPHTDRVEAFMTECPCSAPHDDTVYNLMDKFLGRRLNHFLIEKEGRFIGLLSTGDVIKAIVQDKTEELVRLNRTMSWDYYEEWKWQPGQRKK